jgi:plastocyanin
MTHIVVGLFLATAVVSLIAHAQDKQDGKCVGIGYQSDKCECAPDDKGHKCPCAKCTGDGKCGCMSAVRKPAGTVSGTVKLYRAKVKTAGDKSDKDLVMYLEKVGNNDYPAPTKMAKVDQRGLVFIPHVLAIQRGTPIQFHNSDNDKHNVYFLYDVSGKTKTLDMGTWVPGIKRIHTFKERKEVTVLCKLHLEMAAYIVVLDNPFFTMVEIDEKTQQASFTIKNIPPGTYQLRAWHKKLKLQSGPQEVVVKADQSTKVELVITKAKYVKTK